MTIMWHWFLEQLVRVSIVVNSVPDDLSLHHLEWCGGTSCPDRWHLVLGPCIRRVYGLRSPVQGSPGPWGQLALPYHMKFILLHGCVQVRFLVIGVNHNSECSRRLSDSFNPNVHTPQWWTVEILLVTDVCLAKKLKWMLLPVTRPSSSQQRSLTPKALAACKRALDFIVALYPGLLTLAFVACSSNTGKPDRTESRPGWYHPNTYHNNFTILSGYRCYHDKSEVYVTCTNMHDYIKFSAKKKNKHIDILW